jgi:hypothetical protein
VDGNPESMFIPLPDTLSRAHMNVDKWPFKIRGGGIGPTGPGLAFI